MSRLMRRFWVWAFQRRGWPDPESALDYPAKMARWLDERDAFLEQEDAE